jgi:hypothetical protein
MQQDIALPMHPFDLSNETMPNFIHCNDVPWWKINSYEHIDKHASEHRLN